MCHSRKIHSCRQGSLRIHHTVANVKRIFRQDTDMLHGKQQSFGRWFVRFHVLTTYDNVKQVGQFLFIQ